MFRASISSRRDLSSASCASASFTMRSTSTLLRPEEPAMVIFCSLPVATSFAETLTMPLASMSNTTSICGTPRGAGGQPTRWKSPRARRPQADELRAPQRTVVARHLTLALQHVHLDARLVIRGRREDLALANRNGRVAGDQRRHHATQCLDTERQRRDVEQQYILHFTLEDAALDGRADRDDFVRIHAFM